MQRRAWLAGLAGVLVIGWTFSSGSEDVGAQGSPFSCSDRTITGTYGIQMQGTRPVPPAAGGGVETVIGVVIRTYDGAGNFTQIDNVKGSVTGLVPDRPGFGTYQVHSDCTALIQLQPGPGILIEERMVIVDHGRELRSIVASPLPVMVSAVHQRIGPR